MTAKEENQPPDLGDKKTPVVHNRTSGSDLRAQTLAKQESVKWFAGTLAGVAVTLGFSAQIGNISSFKGSDQAWALSLTCGGLLCIAIGIYLAFHVLLPGAPSITKSARELVDERLLVVALPQLSDVTQEHIVQIDDLSKIDELFSDPDSKRQYFDRTNNVRFLDEAIQKISRLVTINDAVGDPSKKSMGARVATRNRELVEAADQARAWLSNRDVSNRVRWAKWWMTITVLVSVAALMGMILTSANAATIAEATANRTIKQPTPANLIFSQTDVKTFKHAFRGGGGPPPGCVTPIAGEPVPATAVEGTFEAPVLEVTYPGCGTVTIPETHAVDLGANASAQKVHIWLSKKDAKTLAEKRSDPKSVGYPQCHPREDTQIDGTLEYGTLAHPLTLIIDGYTNDVTEITRCFPTELEVGDGTRVQAWP